MDNLNYTPKRLQSNNNKSYTNTNPNFSTNQILDKGFNINDQNLFPNLISDSIVKKDNEQSTINWNNISKNITDEPIKELNKKKNITIDETKELADKIIADKIIADKVVIDKIKASYVDESGWTHIVKSNKPTYKEKKKKNKNQEAIDKLIEEVVKK